MTDASKYIEPLRIAWIKTPPCPVCGVSNGVCAKPPGVVHEELCASCGHTRKCHEW